MTVCSLYTSHQLPRGRLNEAVLLRIDDKERSNGPSSAGAGASEVPESTASTAEKLLRAIQKKLRQCEALQVNARDGQSLNAILGLIWCDEKLSLCSEIFSLALHLR